MFDLDGLQSKLAARRSELERESQRSLEAAREQLLAETIRLNHAHAPQRDDEPKS